MEYPIVKRIDSEEQVFYLGKMRPKRSLFTYDYGPKQGVTECTVILPEYNEEKAKQNYQAIQELCWRLIQETF